ncbi:MAG: hypothetical protein K2Y37_25765 [Pirellulales bacterium]|nr:hypothetical protein [Pirellulales bacterium]
MSTTEFRQRVFGIQQCWSGQERRRREKLGHHRAAWFIASILEPECDDDAVWAVGSLTPDDMARLGGRGG